MYFCLKSLAFLIDIANNVLLKQRPKYPFSSSSICQHNIFLVGQLHCYSLNRLTLFSLFYFPFFNIVFWPIPQHLHLFTKCTMISFLFPSRVALILSQSVVDLPLSSYMLFLCSSHRRTVWEPCWLDLTFISIRSFLAVAVIKASELWAAMEPELLITVAAELEPATEMEKGEEEGEDDNNMEEANDRATAVKIAQYLRVNKYRWCQY